jgi:succinate dehydrogenase / fumarate reductase membrane anchor subunit
MSDKAQNLRSPMSRVRGLGSAHSGTGHFWHQRLTAVAGIPLTIFFVVVVMSLMGSGHARVVQILGSPLVAIGMMLFVWTMVYHMWLGMQVVVEDYVHHEFAKIALIMSNTFFCVVIAVVCTFALLKMSWGV